MSYDWNVPVYQGCFWHCIRHDKCILRWQAVDIDQGYVSREARFPSSSNEDKLLNTFEFIKAVSDTVFDMINAVYDDKTLIFTGAIRSSLSRLFLTLYLTCWSRQAFSLYQGYTFKFIKAVFDTVFDMINAIYYNKTLIFIGAMRSSLSRLFLTLYLTW